MFKFLKEKIGNWARKLSEEVKKEPEEIKIKKISKKKPEKEKKEEGKRKRSEEEIKEERKISAHIHEDIQKEQKRKEEELKELEKKKGFFEKISEKFGSIIISEEEFKKYSEEFESLLLENNVALEVAEKILKEFGERTIGKEMQKKEVYFYIKNSLKEVIGNILIDSFDSVEKIKEKKEGPYVILFCGINGTGKTTTIAKVASLLKKMEISCVIAAADTFRAASIEQIKNHGEKISIKVISGQYGSDPASVAFDAIKYAKKNHIKCVLIDTAGRMHTSKNLMEEIGKIARVCDPDLKIFVGESTTGNDAVEQAKAFNNQIKIDGIILTKADVDEKGGAVLSVGYATKKPILYFGTGQEYDKLELFDKKKFVEKLGL